ncbi:MAG: hypothetical protein WA277_13980 [Nitrospirota bacterium]
MEIPLFDYTKKKYTSEEAMAFEDAVERLVEETLKTLVLFLEEYSFHIADNYIYRHGKPRYKILEPDYKSEYNLRIEPDHGEENWNYFWSVPIWWEGRPWQSFDWIKQDLIDTMKRWVQYMSFKEIEEEI